MREAAWRVLDLATCSCATVSSLVVLCTAAVVPAYGAVQARGHPTAEIGTSLGVTILAASGLTSETHIGVPGGVGPVSTFSPVVYASFFATPSVIVEPQVSFSRTSGGGDALTLFLLAGQVGYLFTPNEKGSPYVALSGAFLTFSQRFAPSGNGPGFGGELGYRFKVKASLGIRVDARYRRWFSDFSDLNEIGFGVGFGAIL